VHNVGRKATESNKPRQSSFIDDYDS